MAKKQITNKPQTFKKGDVLVLSGGKPSKRGEVGTIKKKPVNLLAERLKLEKEMLDLEEAELKLRAADARYRAENKAEFAKFLPHQQRVIEFLRNNKKTILMVTGNRGGKCCTYQTKIDTLNGEMPVGELFDIGKPFKVWAWDGKKKVIATAKAPFKKEGIHKCYRIEMSDGRFIEAADHHRILTSHGWLYVEELHASFVRWSSPCSHRKYSSSRHQSISGFCQSIQPSDDVHLLENRQGFREDYLGDYCQYDERLRNVQDSGPTFAPLQGDVLQPVSCDHSLDDLGNKYNDNLFVYEPHPSNKDEDSHPLGLFSGFLNSGFCNASLSCRDEHPLSEQPSTVVISPFQSVVEAFPHQDLSSLAYLSPLCIDGNSIVSFYPITSQEVYDFEVEEYHNYFAGGLIHHNTTVGAIIVACLCVPHLRGKLHLDFLTETFPAKDGRIRILCKDWEHFAATVMVPALKEWCPAGTYTTKKNNVGIDYFWTFKSGWTIEIITNKQATEDQEGWKGHFVWQDETTTRDKYVANKRGLIDYSGVYLMTFTAVDASWVLDDIVLKADPAVGCITGVSSYENTYLPVQDIDNFRSTLTDNEKKARIDGNFLNLEGRIWKVFDNDKHIVDDFKIPPDWPVAFQIDFHLSLPHAISFCAVDKYDRFYICSELWENCGSEELANEIIRRKTLYGWRMKHGEIDALSKGDTSYVKNRYGNTEDSFSVIEKKLRVGGIRLGVGSKDEKSYIKAIETRLKGPNGMPTLFIFRSCTETIKQVQRWSYDENNKPRDDGHFPECIGRFSQMGLKYTDPQLWTQELQYQASPV